MDAKALGASFNLNMKCWETLLPHVVRHPLVAVDLMPLLKAYQRQYPGAMYSGCGGGYLIVVSDKPVPGAFKVNVRIDSKMSSPKTNHRLRRIRRHQVARPAFSGRGGEAR